MASALLQYALGTRIVIHTLGASSLGELLHPGADLLLVPNHRTRLDWMFLWGLAIAFGGAGGLKIVLKDSLRAVPGFGWATQCFGFAFMTRRDRAADLQTLRDVCSLHGGRGDLALLLFPEGTDLSKGSLERSRAFAEAEGLQAYEQVLQPRTAGFSATCTALRQVAKARGAPPPVLLDITMGYVDFLPGERPSEASVFMKGRPPRELHLLIGREQMPGEEAAPLAEDAEASCRRLFDAKDRRLRQFYLPCPSAEPDIRALAAKGCEDLLDIPGVRGRLLRGVAVVAGIEALATAVAWNSGAPFTAAAFGCCCLAFVVVTKATGGIDQLLFRHNSRWPGSEVRSMEEFVPMCG